MYVLLSKVVRVGDLHPFSGLAASQQSGTFDVSHGLEWVRDDLLAPLICIAGVRKRDDELRNGWLASQAGCWFAMGALSSI